MNLSAGTRIGPYEILAPIGSGAMGDVYKAKDTRLGRDIAIKVLPPVFAQDPDRLARFEREARAVAAINHPNILSVHDVGMADVTTVNGSVRVTYMITELLDGDTLRARIQAGPLSPRKAIDAAIQIARGLAAAHDRGIVHRDLKPENIVLLRDGHVKILDFGLAKQAPDPKAAANLETMAASTDAGTVLGTVGYMAPEQVRGEAVDARSDLFALGAVAYELATGQRAFVRPTAAETMTAILRDEAPDLPATVPHASPGLSRVIHHALEKDPGDRFQSARDFAFALQALTDPGSTGASAAATAVSMRRPFRGRELAAWLLAGVLALVVAAALWWPRNPASSSAAKPIVVSVTPPRYDGVLSSPAVAPDGLRIAFISSSRGTDSIVIRRLDDAEMTPLKGTANVRHTSIFWSPDGTAIGFAAGGKLKVLDLASGKIDELADAPDPYGGSWGPDGTILFSPDGHSPIYRVSAKGGPATAVTKLDASGPDEAHRWPQFLPDGRRFVYMPWKSSSTSRPIQLTSLDGMPPRKLFDSPTGVIVAGHYFLYVREHPANVLAQAFDPNTVELVGQPVPITNDDNVDFQWGYGDPFASASQDTLVYTTGKLRSAQLTWFNRLGQAIGQLGEPDTYYDPAISPDGTRLAIEKAAHDTGTTDLWTVDLARGVFSRLTTARGFESTATWSPDGRTITFSSDQGPSPKVYSKDASGSGPEVALIDHRGFPSDWSHDGRYLLYAIDSGATGIDVWIYDAEKKTSAPLLQTPFNERSPSFSPDGRWIAYESGEADYQVYVQSFPGAANRHQVSSAGGREPAWRRDGKELFYMAPDGMLMSVAIQQNGNTLTLGAAQPLFNTGIELGRGIRNHYAASNDGQRFLVLKPLVDQHSSPLVAVLNWQATIKPQR